jgi:proteic killer suppression protein
MNQVYKITINPKAKKQLAKVPAYIVTKLQAWVDAVSHDSIFEVRKISGYHDEPLQGNRTGQRSIRLNKSYRAIYTELDSGEIFFIEIIEVHNHEY